MMHFFSVFTLMTLVHILIIIGVSYRIRVQNELSPRGQICF